ncbi:MAG: DNA polymerase IV [Microscillaceae bacterium]
MKDKKGEEEQAVSVYRRKIIHIDMDAFFASVEQRDFPELRGQAVAVGGAGDRGVVAAASYEARRFGVFSAMSSKVALRKCPQLIFVKPRFEVYRQVSYQIRAIFQEYTDLIEPLSLDEAYLDVSVNKKNLPSATLLARELKQKIKDETQLTASAGVSYNKFLAKVASAYQKPDGLFVITPAQAEAFVARLPIEKFHGIGKVTAARLKKMGVYTGQDLRRWDEAQMIQLFGKVGRHYFFLARAIDERPVNPDRLRKSLGTENTYAQDVQNQAEAEAKLKELAIQLADELAKKKLKGRTLTLKVKYADFRQITRSKTLSYAFSDLETIRRIYTELLQSLPSPWQAVRLLGLQIANFEEPIHRVGLQLALDFEGGSQPQAENERGRDYKSPN